MSFIFLACYSYSSCSPSTPPSSFLPFHSTFRFFFYLVLNRVLPIPLSSPTCTALSVLHPSPRVPSGCSDLFYIRGDVFIFFSFDMTRRVSTRSKVPGPDCIGLHFARCALAVCRRAPMPIRGFHVCAVTCTLVLAGDRWIYCLL